MKEPIDQAIQTVDESPAVYVLLGSDGNYLYKGACRNLKERLKDHRAGSVSGSARDMVAHERIILCNKQAWSYVDIDIVCPVLIQGSKDPIDGFPIR